MTEAQLLDQVLLEARRRRLFVHHNPDSRRDKGSPGFPDLVLASPKGVIFAELKDPGGDPSGDQKRWRYVLQAAGARWTLWRPADLGNGLVLAELSSLVSQLP